MMIERITLHSGRVPVDLRFSYGAPTHMSFGLAEIHADGQVGYGECIAVPNDGGAALAHTLLGQDARRLDALLGEPLEYGDWPAFQPNVVREMLSMALYDLVAKAHGLPLCALLGGARRTAVPLMPCIFPRSATDAGEVARAWVDQGYQALKVKLFGQLTEDCAILRAVRRAFPEGYLQADVNGGYKDYDKAVMALCCFGDAGLTVCEDPLDGTVEEYAGLCAEADQPRVMVDSLSRGWRGLADVCGARAAHIVNLHPNMQGTLSEILARAAVAQSAGIPVMIGGTGYPGVGTWAHAHIAAVVGLDYAYGDLSGARDHGMPEPSADLLPVVDGALALTAEPGHGGVLREEFVGRYAETTSVLANH